ncbi:hypothetical protein HGA13_29525 [Nocardia speluncae]|uniref:Uncharacterized protein n=1 Tax=Nocardia speluncae TaxID=419477 RepID=A0A846XLG6_9NOCA|nr:hypothetical protein [Nocardia speluncae]NKY37181.1 hypothetical protein [Nocardia speluncae]
MTVPENNEFEGAKWGEGPSVGGTKVTPESEREPHPLPESEREPHPLPASDPDPDPDPSPPPGAGTSNQGSGNDSKGGNDSKSGNGSKSGKDDKETLAENPCGDGDVRILPITDGELVCPSGASPGLRSYIACAENAIGKAIELLAGGVKPLPPPNPSVEVPAIAPLDTGTSKMATVYRDVADNARAQYSFLWNSDSQVVTASDHVATEKQAALHKIGNIVRDLNAKLSAADGRKLTTAQEVSLMQGVSQAVARVYEQLSMTAEYNTQVANGSDGSGGTVPNLDGLLNQVGGVGGLESLLPMLAAAIPMAGMAVPELLKAGEGQAGAATETAVATGEATELSMPDAAGVVPIADVERGSLVSDTGQPGLHPSLPGLGRTSTSRRAAGQQVSNTGESVEEDEAEAVEPDFLAV